MWFMKEIFHEYFSEENTFPVPPVMISDLVLPSKYKNHCKTISSESLLKKTMKIADSRKQTSDRQIQDFLFDLLAYLVEIHLKGKINNFKSLDREYNALVNDRYLYTDPDDEQIIQELKKIMDDLEKIKNSSLPSDISGRYSDEEYLITLYYKVMDDNRGSVSNTLAHELFHAFQYKLSGEYAKNSANADLVREAAADMFAFLWNCHNYSDNEYLEAAFKRYEQWDYYAGTSWPYAYAMKMMKANTAFTCSNDLTVFEKSTEYKNTINN